MTLDPEKIPIIEADIGDTLKTIAGAGTGKTSVLVERYLRFVIDDGIPPARLLALTFTKKAASEMRKRIYEEAAKRGKKGVLRELHTAWIMNFHQFAFRIIKDSAAAFGIDPGVEVASDIDASRIRRLLYRRFEAGRIGGFPEEYGDDVPEPGRLRSKFDRWFDIVAKARGTLWSPDGLMEAVRSDDTPEYRRIVQSVAALWTAYEDELRRRGLIDFAGMIRIAVFGLWEREPLRRRYAGAFDHILVDEFQDTNEAQNELLRILSGGDFARVTVVGDDKQSIYRWRDARVQNLRDFSGREYFLRTNHRSTQSILDIAHYFIVADPYFEKHADEIRLKAHRGESDVPICVYHPADGSERSYADEARALAAWVLSVTGRLGGASPFACYRGERKPLGFGDVAVLMRGLKASTGLGAYERAFREAGIPYAVSGSGGSLEVRALERLRDLLRVIVYPGDVHALLGVLEAAPFAIPDGCIKELFDAAGGQDADAILSDDACGKLSSEKARDGCLHLRSLVEDLRVKRLTLDFPAFVSYALEAGPFYYGLFEDGADERLVESVLETLFDLVDRLVARGEGNLASFCEALQALAGGKALDDGRGSTLPAGRVQIMTIHSAKGLQFPAVAVPGIREYASRSEGFHLSPTDGLFLTDATDWSRGLDESEAYESEKADEEQEERCLLYVAMTRARDHLFVSSPSPNGTDKKKDGGLFGVILDALRKNAIPHEELRAAPDVPSIGSGRGSAHENARGSARESADDRGPGGPARAEESAENLAALLDVWSAERERLSAASCEPHRAPDVEFVTWRRLHTFVRCPAMYDFRYVAGMRYLPEAEGAPAAPDVSGEDTDELSGEFRLPGGMDPKIFGSFVHRLLFEWMASEKASKAARETFVSNVARGFGFSARREAGLLRTAGEILGAFTESPLSERGHVEGLELPVEARLERLVFRGTLDRIDRTPEGLRIVDYKGKTPRDEYEYQVRFYAWILEMAGRSVSKDACLCYLTRPVGVASVDVSHPRRKAIERDARRLEEATERGRFDPTPGTVCETCAFRGICPHRREGAAGSSSSAPSESPGGKSLA